MNGSPRERAPDDPTAASGGTATHDADGDASWQDLGDGLWLAAAWSRAGHTSTGEAETGPDRPPAGAPTCPPTSRRPPRSRACPRPYPPRVHNPT
ncbi:hypothetical protein GA0115239_10543 [Streptomyces sp. BpilaLS-43]|nr:hypothetical protein GA0115239_10543 [Streptomyces sp. BpilaLS-43]